MKNAYLILMRVVRVGLRHTVTFAQGLEGSEGVREHHGWGRGQIQAERPASIKALIRKQTYLGIQSRSIEEALVAGTK